MPTDIEYMTEALHLAAQGLGRVAPNPSVGCLIVKDGIVVGKARTADGGRPHAEPQALQQAGEKAKGATMYVTLEPCVHHGRTLPCTDEIIAAQIGKVVIACLDPDKRVSGAGVKALQAAGIEIVMDVCKAEALELNDGFFKRIQNYRPLITLKMATSLDGKIASANNESQWITGEQARLRVHDERSRHDAILTGIGTVLKDDPLLTTRIDGVNHESLRVILDTHLRFPLDAKILETVWLGGVTILTGPNVNSEKKALLEQKGVKIVELDVSASGSVSLPFAMEYLANEGITRLMVEAGQTVSTSFLKMKLWDRFLLFRAPIIIGKGGMDVFGEIEPTLAKAPRMKLINQEKFGEDMLEIFAKA